MKKRFRVLILGKGRIGRAIFYYLQKFKATGEVAFFYSEIEVEKYDLLVGALPGEEGEKGLKMALRYKKDFIDLADLEPEFYLKQEKKIKSKGITVIPGCGFCPGLVNLILGRETVNFPNIREVEVKAGTLSPREFFFPFLWCFEDLVLEHQINSEQTINGRKVKLPPFSGYQIENFYGIKSETYFASSGFENLMKKARAENFTFRVIRPSGFFHFFQFLANQGFLESKNFQTTKAILEKRKEDNLSLAEIRIKMGSKRTIWRIKSFSRKTEVLNSMQKITGLTAAAIAKLLLENKIKNKGLVPMEEIGKDEKLFKGILKMIRTFITCKRSASKSCG